MARSSLESKIARLQEEIERLAARHKEQMAQGKFSGSPEMRELAAKRANILARRARQLRERLKELRHELGSSARVGRSLKQ